MTYTYNHDRPHDVRHDKCEELERKSCLRDDARYVVIRGYAAYDGLGEVLSCSSERQTFFDNLRTARAYAHHASDMYDAQFGIFRYEFVQGVDVR